MEIANQSVKENFGMSQKMSRENIPWKLRESEHRVRGLIDRGRRLIVEKNRLV